jgi:ribose 1,5-bisphosphate isomerase
MPDIAQITSDITSLKIQGATNVALAVLDTIADTISNEPEVPIADLKKIATDLAYARPTEPLAQNALRYIFTKDVIGSLILEKVASYKAQIKNAKISIAAFGRDVFADGGTYLTHCHASTVTNAILSAHKDGKKLHMIATETRPLMQGRKTVKELLDGGMPDVTMIIDSAAASVLADQDRNIKGVVIGADLLSEKGFVNKIGSFSIISAALSRGIPVYCFSTLLKYDPRPWDTKLIETRDPKEIWPEAPETLKIFAPAFDYTPYQDGITFVTEQGPINGAIVKDTATQMYPFTENV